jgi:hypothetical protein
MRRRGLLAGTLAAAIVVVAGASSVAAGHASEAPAAAPVALVEAAECAHPTPLPAVTDARTNGDTLVSFAVPNETRLRVGATGDVFAASTNTKCHPHVDDVVVVVGGDGARRAATPNEIDQALARFQSGDWREPGVWHTAD